MKKQLKKKQDTRSTFRSMLDTIILPLLSFYKNYFEWQKAVAVLLDITILVIAIFIIPPTTQLAVIIYGSISPFLFIANIKAFDLLCFRGKKLDYEDLSAPSHDLSVPSPDLDTSSKRQGSTPEIYKKMPGVNLGCPPSSSQPIPCPKAPSPHGSAASSADESETPQGSPSPTTNPPIIPVGMIGETPDGIWFQAI